MKGLAMELAYTEETARLRCPESGGVWGRLSCWDVGLSASLRLVDSRWRRLGKIVTHSGDAIFWLATAAVMFFLPGTPTWQEVALRLVQAIVGAGVVAAGLKRLIRRPRPDGPPDGLYPIHDHYSLPSGHAVRVAAIATVLGPLIPGWLIAVLALWAAAVALSRVLLGVHYLLDVLSGIVLGGMVGLVLMLVG
jgi:undecaprenyl-diphosphatase